MQPLVYIVATGGTIASNYLASEGDLVAPASADDLVSATPELASYAEVRSVQHTNITSDLMDISSVVELGKLVRKLLEDNTVTGVVITHGTATLEETAFFLDLTIKNEKPVVVTGAMRNLSETDADGPRNILYSVLTAAHSDSRGRGVLVCFNGEIYSARDVIKVHSMQVNAYASRDSGPLGMVSKDGLIYFAKPERRIFINVEEISANVQLLKVTQGIDDLLIRACIENDVDGIVIEGIGAGNVNIPYYNAVCDALKADIPLVIGHRMSSGSPFFNKGHNGSFRSMIDKGAIPSGYLSCVKARILLMVALSHTDELETIRHIFSQVSAMNSL